MKQKIDPAKLDVLASMAAPPTEAGWIPRYTRLPPDLDAAVNEVVASVPGLDRSKLMRTALAHYIGFERAGRPTRRPSRPARRAAAGQLQTA